jgi:hypothetical protein
MNQFETVVHDTMSELIGKQELFTALDVSNAVKSGSASRPPFPCRHSDVRSVVRSAYQSGALTNYGRTSIQVRLQDGTMDNSLLYYPNHLSQSDIDDQYPDSRRGIAPTPSPTVIKAARAMITRPKMLGQMLAARAAAAGKALLGTTDD